MATCSREIPTQTRLSAVITPMIFTRFYISMNRFSSRLNRLGFIIFLDIELKESWQYDCWKKYTKRLFQSETEWCFQIIFPLFAGEQIPGHSSLVCLIWTNKNKNQTTVYQCSWSYTPPALRLGLPFVWVGEDKETNITDTRSYHRFLNERFWFINSIHHYMEA